MKTIIILLAFGFSLLGCQPSKKTASDFSQSLGIINGQPVSQSEQVYFMTARILVESGKGYWMPSCTASILSEELILTAAHCVEDIEVGSLRVGFGDLSKLTTAEVVGVVAHPGFSVVEYDHDIALIRIAGKIPTGFQPVPLLSQEQIQTLNEDTNYQVLLAGFGLFAEEPLEESEVLRKTSVPAKFEGLHLVTDQTGGSGACSGDSGGPAYLEISGKLFLVGVTHGPKLENLDCHHEGVFGNPSLEKEFLNEAAAQLKSETRFN